MSHPLHTGHTAACDVEHGLLVHIASFIHYSLTTLCAMNSRHQFLIVLRWYVNTRALKDSGWRYLSECLPQRLLTKYRDQSHEDCTLRKRTNVEISSNLSDTSHSASFFCICVRPHRSTRLDQSGKSSSFSVYRRFASPHEHVVQPATECAAEEWSNHWYPVYMLADVAWKCKEPDMYQK